MDRLRQRRVEWMAEGLGRYARGATAAGLAAVLGLIAAGCGGLPAQQQGPTGVGVVAVAALDKATNKPITVDAVVVIGGLRATLKSGDGFVVFNNVPLGADTPPHQPLTVTAKGYVTSSQQSVLNASQATYLAATLDKADLTKTGTVQGKVIAYGTSAPIANSVVTFRLQTAGSTVSIQGFTANDGTYVIGGIPVGNMSVTAEAAGFLPGSAEATVTADSGGANPELNFTLVSGDTKVDVTGKVLDVRTHAPLAGAQVVVGTQPTVTAGADGRFVVPSVGVGSVPITVTLAGYDNFTDTLSVLPGMGLVTVTLNKTEANPPTAPYNLTGTVTVEGAADNSGVTVTAFDLVRAVEGGRTTTNAAGAYFLLLPPGQYRVEATLGSTTIGRTVTIRNGRVVSGIDFALTP